MTTDISTGLGDNPLRSQATLPPLKLKPCIIRAKPYLPLPLLPLRRRALPGWVRPDPYSPTTTSADPSSKIAYADFNPLTDNVLTEPNTLPICPINP